MPFAILATVLSLLLGFKAWISDDPLFNLNPLSIEIGQMPTTVLFFLVIGGLLAYLYRGLNVILIPALLLWVFLTFFNLYRIQPYYLQLGIILLVGALCKNKEKSAIIILQLYLISMYLWSGIHKINPFFGEDLHYAIEQAGTILPAGLLKGVADIVPFIEIGIGIGLFIPFLRNIITFLAIALHIGIIVFLSPLGLDYNIIVIPWNLGMIGVVFGLFFKSDIQLFRWNSHRPALIAGFVLLLIPAISLFTLRGNVACFNVYSGKIVTAYMEMDEESLNKLPERMQKHAFEYNGHYAVDIIQFTIEEGGIAIPPEPLAYKAFFKTLCRKYDVGHNFSLTLMSYKSEPITYETWTCVQLK